MCNAYDICTDLLKLEHENLLLLDTKTPKTYILILHDKALMLCCRHIQKQAHSRINHQFQISSEEIKPKTILLHFENKLR